MGKKKRVKTVQNNDDPETLKELGNKAFMEKEFDKAIELYT